MVFIHSRLNVIWQVLGAMSAVAKDIHIQNLNLRISVKESADVFINASPEKHLAYAFGKFSHSERGTATVNCVPIKPRNTFDPFRKANLPFNTLAGSKPEIKLPGNFQQVSHHATNDHQHSGFHEMAELRMLFS